MPDDRPHDPLVARLLDVVEGQMAEQRKSNRALMKWMFALMSIQIVAVVALGGANLAVQTGIVDISTQTEKVAHSPPPPRPMVAPPRWSDTGLSDVEGPP